MAGSSIGGISGNDPSRNRGGLGSSSIRLPSLADLNLTGRSSAAASSSTPPPTVNQTNYNPQMNDALTRILGRASGDAGAGTAIDLAGGKIREASIGAQKEAAVGRQMRGASGTSANSYDQAKISDATQKAIAGSASDISSAAEARKDTLLGSAANVAGSMAQLAQGDRSLALQQWQEQEANRRADENARIAQQQAQLQALLQLSQMATTL
jgi:hypothetical protein